MDEVRELFGSWDTIKPDSTELIDTGQAQSSPFDGSLPILEQVSETDSTQFLKPETTLKDLSVVEQPVFKKTFLLGEEDPEYDLRVFLDREKEYMAKITPIIMEILAKEGTISLSVKKSELVAEEQISSVSNHDDQIEFQLRKQNGEVSLFVRNKRLIELMSRPKPKGEVLEMTTDEVRRFCNENKDDERLNIAHIREVLPAPGEVDETKKFFGFINDVGGISGVACVLEGRGGSAILHRLATNPSLQSLGVGGAMIEFLKGQYKSINLVPTPEGIIKGDTGDPFEDLRQFYIRRGFVPGMPFVWQEDWINLDDSTKPGEWREFNEAKNLLVFDGFKLKGDEVSDVFLSEVWRNNRNEIIGEARDGLDWFMEVRSQIKRDQVKLKRLREERQKQ